jgi:hypothetical protein
MATTQKTWTELLGPITDADFVDGNSFVRNTQDGWHQIMWTFPCGDRSREENEKSVCECFELWRTGQ